MNSITRYRSALSRLGAFAVALVFTACGGTGGVSSNPTANNVPPPSASCATDCNSVLVAMTDADGDFLSYTVDVVSLELKRPNGTVVEMLPATTRIDFAQLVDLSELITVGTIPNGAYFAVSMRLDYGNAEITVERGGVPVAAQAVDASGNALGIVDVHVTLDNRHHLVVSPGRPSLLSFDFNLAASNSVDLATTPATVTVTPALVASLDFVEQKELRVRGPLVSVDTAAGTYVADVRPSHGRSMRFGQLTVHTDANTAFEIDGTNYTGSPGLAALAAAGAGTITTAFGTLDKQTREFHATVVHAGTSVPGAGVDTVLGEVVSRSGDVLTVRGATVVRNSDGAHFARGRVQVTIGPDTTVVKGGTAASPTAAADAISVGQSIAAFGTASPVGSASKSGDWTLDATAGRVRMNPTSIFGFVKQASAGALTLQLESISGRRVSSFDFAGTGASPDQDADPMNYEAATSTLNLSGASVGEPVKLIGFPTPFGLAPPDFEGRTLIDFPRLPAVLSLTWGRSGTTAPFSSQEATALVLNLENADIGRVHFLSVGPRVLDLLRLPAAPSIVPPGSGPSAYLIVMRGESLSFQDFGDFVAELSTRLNGTTAMVGLTATGSYNGDSNTLTARSLVAVLR